MAHSVQGLLLCWNFIMSSPELKPNKITDDEVKNRSTIELRQSEPLLIANKTMRIYSSASIAPNPILCLQFNKFNSQVKVNIRKNKVRIKTVKPHRCLAFTT